ncbi:MAG: CPBP family intramembrane metalloprotease [Clostridiales bacterium]|nr:CPBP family intramembrane metalloprotease [Clostridiales bacterium]
MNIKEEFTNINENSHREFNLSLIFLTLILFIYCYFGSFSFFENTFNITNLDYYKIIYHNTMAFVLFFLVGMLYIKFVIKKPIKQIGLGIGNWKWGLIFAGVATIIIPLVALSTTIDNGMTSTYPLIDFATYNKWWQILTYFISYLLYYIGWEFLFRGIALQFSKEKIGVVGAILLTTLISALIHTSIGGFGKPMIETLSAIPAGLIFGYVAYKTDSIYYSLYAHALIGFLTDIFIFLIV